MDRQEILVDHLRQALSQLQRYLAFGFTSALVLLVLKLSGTAEGGAGPIAMPLVEFPVDASLARSLLIAICIGTGLLAYAAVLDVGRLAGQIRDRSIRTAALSFPTLATSSDAVVRVVGPLAPAVVFALFLLMDGLRAADATLEWYLFLGMFGIMPYVGVAYEARKFNPGPDPGSEEEASSGDT